MHPHCATIVLVMSETDESRALCALLLFRVSSSSTSAGPPFDQQQGQMCNGCVMNEWKVSDRVSCGWLAVDLSCQDEPYNCTGGGTKNRTHTRTHPPTPSNTINQLFVYYASQALHQTNEHEDACLLTTAVAVLPVGLPAVRCTRHPVPQ